MYQGIKNWHLSVLVGIISIISLAIIQQHVLAQWNDPIGLPGETSGFRLVVNPMTEDLNLNSYNLKDTNLTIDGSGTKVVQILNNANLCLNGDCRNIWPTGGGGGLWNGVNPGDIYYTGGNVGIGTTTPDSALQLYSNVAGGSNLKLSNPTGDMSLIFQEYGNKPGDFFLSYDGNNPSMNSGYANWLEFWGRDKGNVGAVPILSMQRDYSNIPPTNVYQSVGIGVPSKTLIDAKLRVQGGTLGEDLLQLTTNAGVNKFVVNSNGNVGIGTNNPNKQLHILSPSGQNAEIDIQSNTSPHWGVYQDDITDDLRFWNVNNRVTFTDTGNVGIGTTNPTSKLEVAGNMELNGNIYRSGTSNFFGAACAVGSHVASINSNGTFNCTADTGGSGGTPLTEAQVQAYIFDSDPATVPGVWSYTARPTFNGGTSGSLPPFSVDSTYKVTNLNADLLDGYSATAFQDDIGTDCGIGNYIYGIYDNGTLKCRADQTGSATGDNLGNHIATQNIQLGTHYLSGDGSSVEGIAISASGKIAIISHDTTNLSLETNGGIEIGKNTSGVAIKVDNKEALWYGTSNNRFSWGYGGASNYFADRIGIGIQPDDSNYMLNVNGNINVQGTNINMISTLGSVITGHGTFSNGRIMCNWISNITQTTFDCDNPWIMTTNYSSAVLGKTSLSDNDIENTICWALGAMGSNNPAGSSDTTYQQANFNTMTYDDDQNNWQGYYLISVPTSWIYKINKVTCIR